MEAVKLQRGRLELDVLSGAMDEVWFLGRGANPPLRSRPPEIQLGGLRERCKVLQRGLVYSPSQNRIWYILALK